MHICGIIAEYDPFHTGHAYQISRTREALGEDTGIVAVISGNWVQRACCAFADKWTRARLALLGGVDLVLELPTPWAAGSAERFAQGAAALLEAAGVVDTLSFGSECGSVAPLEQVAVCLNRDPFYPETLRSLLDQGMPFAACRQAAVRERLGGELSALLEHPNNNLAVEYLRALDAMNSDIRPMTVQRRGAGHNSLSGGTPPFLSGSQLRLELSRGNWAFSQRYLVPGAREVLGNAPGPASLERVERAMLALVYTMTAEDWAALPDSGAAEGLPHRLEAAGRRCASIEQFLELAKTRRYPHSRLRRLMLWAFLGLTAEDAAGVPPYLRVLGFNGRGREILREMKGRARLPVLTKSAHARRLPEPALRLFQQECRATDLYGLCLPLVPPPGAEWRQGPVTAQNNSE